MVQKQSQSPNNNSIVFTKKAVVNSMLDLIDYQSHKNLKGIKILEPSAGEGAFVIEILKRLYKSSLKFNFSFEEEINNLSIYEIEQKNTAILKNNLKLLFKQLGISPLSIEINMENH